jgi:hypothetical protein
VLDATPIPDRGQPQIFGIDMCVLQRISYSLLVAFCYRHLPPPDRNGPARQITEPTSASGGRAARQVPAPAAGSVLRWRVSLWRDWLVPLPAARQRLGRLAPHGRKEAGIPMLSSAPGRDPDAGPTAQESTSWPALTSMRPGHRPFRAPLSDRR